MDDLINKYNLLQMAIHRVVEDNRCRGQDNVVDNLDILIQIEEEFGCELYETILDLKGEIE